MFCPACRNNNKQRRLLLKQINLSTAVYVCEEEKCIYPVGYEWTFVQRNLDDIYTWKEQSHVETVCFNSSGEHDIDKWLNEIFDATPCETSSLNNNDNTFDLTEFEAFLNSPDLVDNKIGHLEEEHIAHTEYNEELKKKTSTFTVQPIAANQKQSSHKISYVSYIIKPADTCRIING